MKGSLKMLTFVVYFILDIFFPEKCLRCKQTGSTICLTCKLELRKVERETSKGVEACFDYRDPIVKKMIWCLKYKARSSIGTTMGKLLYNQMQAQLQRMQIYSDPYPILIVPIPLSRMRKRVRGYNQAYTIAKGFVDSAPIGTCILDATLVVKRKDTTPQAQITSRTKRLHNIVGAFSLTNPNKVLGRTIIIIDDVTTTGATMREMSTLLEASGAKKVVGFAFAH